MRTVYLAAMYGIPILLVVHWGWDTLLRNSRHIASRLIAGLYGAAAFLLFALFSLQVVPSQDAIPLVQFAILPLRWIIGILGIRLYLYLLEWPKNARWRRLPYLLIFPAFAAMLYPNRILTPLVAQQTGFWMMPNAGGNAWISGAILFVTIAFAAALIRVYSQSRRPYVRGRLACLIWGTATLAAGDVVFGLWLPSRHVPWMPPFAYMAGALAWLFALRRAAVRYSLIPSESERYHNWFERHPGALVLVESNGRIVDMNDAAANLIGPTTRNLNRVFPAATRHRDWARYAQALRVGVTVTNWEQEIIDSQHQPCMLSIDAEVLEVGHEPHWAFSLRDITSQRRQQDMTERLAYTDPLTGIGNAFAFRQQLDRLLARRPIEPAALIFLDLDNFKQINDTYGHPVGDRVLVHVASRLAPLFRPGDMVARLGGDEFVVLLRHIGDLPLTNVLERIMLELAVPLIAPKVPPITVQASIGLSRYPDDAHDPETLLSHADQAMYTAKKAGKNRYYVFPSVIPASQETL